MKNSAAGHRSARRLVPALALLVALGFAAHAAAGELAMLHRVMTAGEPAGRAEGQAPCEAPPGARCAPGLPGMTPAPPAPQVTRLGVETTNCLAGCPTFTAIFAADGTFTYVGEANVERLGEHTGRVDVGRLRQVMRLAEETGFADLDDTYASSYLDNPTSYLLVDWPDRTKVVRADAGVEPATFWALRELLLDLLEDAEWDD